MEVAKVDKLISMESDIFEGTEQFSKVNVLCGCKFILDSAKWVRMIFMGFRKNVICFW